MAKEYRLGPTRKAVNAFASTLLRLGIPVGRSSYLMTTKGRKTGLDRTTPVILVEGGGERWLVSPYGSVPWVYNVRANPEVKLRRGRHVRSVVAAEVGAAEAAPILRCYVRRVRVTAPFFDAKRGDSDEAFATEAIRHPVFRLTTIEAR
jgi:deazaflavin-dependent oxidoreductase (nitroreductase family)